MSRPWRVLIASGFDDPSQQRLASRAELVPWPGGDAASLAAAVAGCDAIAARTHTPVTRAVLEAGQPRLRVVGVAGVGVDRVDLGAAAELGVAVVNTPKAASDAVAEFTIGLMLELLRPIRRLAAMYASGRFEEARKNPHGDELRKMTVGIVGCGAIGSRVGRLCRSGFGARVLYNDIRDVGPLGYDAQPVAKDQLWRESDIVSLHVPLTIDTHGMMNEAVLSAMKNGALLINTCRGEAVDTAALTHALQAGHLGGAGLDVTHPEPLPPEHPLFQLSSCVLTPHVAARTFTGLRNMFGVVDLIVKSLEIPRPAPRRVTPDCGP